MSEELSEGDITDFMKEDIEMEKLNAENKEKKDLEEKFKYKAAQILLPSREKMEENKQMLDKIKEMRLDRK